MEGEIEKFAVISEIYTHFTEKNKKNLIKIAENLLKAQKEDEAIVADATTMSAQENFCWKGL
ncbi:hypothetical protein [Treponema sp. R80B11-R83G3]